MNPFDLITTFLGQIWQFLKGCYSILTGAWGSWVAAGGLTATLALFDWPFEMIASGAETLAQTAATAASYVGSLPVSAQTMQQVNRCFPLNEILVMEGFLLGLYVAVALLRWLKSWIPGMA